jgi:hypothetical protein
MSSRLGGRLSPSRHFVVRRLPPRGRLLGDITCHWTLLAARSAPAAGPPTAGPPRPFGRHESPGARLHVAPLISGRSRQTLRFSLRSKAFPAQCNAACVADTARTCSSRNRVALIHVSHPRIRLLSGASSQGMSEPEKAPPGDGRIPAPKGRAHFLSLKLFCSGERFFSHLVSSRRTPTRITTRSGNRNIANIVHWNEAIAS